MKLTKTGLVTNLLISGLFLYCQNGCGGKPIPPDKRPTPESCIHWLYQNGVDIQLEPDLPPWTFKTEEMSDLKIVRVQEDSKTKQLSADISFKANYKGRSYRVEGTMRYIKSTEFVGLLAYRGYTTTSLKRL